MPRKKRKVATKVAAPPAFAVKSDAQLKGKSLVDAALDLTTDLETPLHSMFQEVSTKFAYLESRQANEPIGEDTLEVLDSGHQPEHAELEHDSQSTALIEFQPTASTEISTSQQLSKSQQRNRIPLIELKKRAPRADVVQWYDADAKEPLLLVAIKSAPGVVQTPPHWQNKQEYLSRQRTHRYFLPKAISATGISQLRNVSDSTEDTSMRTSARERVQPRLGKLDMDFAKLYAAFFSVKETPKLSKLGEVYPQISLYQRNLGNFKPGFLSDRLSRALGLARDQPPPWTAKFSSQGTPPAYPFLKLVSDEPYPPLVKTEPQLRWGEVVTTTSDPANEVESGAGTPDIYVEVEASAAAEDGATEESLSSPDSVIEYARNESDEEVEEAASPSDGDLAPPEQEEPSAKTLYREVRESKEAGGFLGATKRYELD